jgi:CRISPR-associated protein Csm5
MNDRYQLTITTITPLHIGTGSDLLLDYDFVVRHGKTWVIDENALAEWLSEGDPDALDRMSMGVPAADLIPDDAFREDSELFRYVMPGEPRASSRGAVIQEQMKNVWDQPYIPGSSLKGALRTAIFYGGWQQRGTKFNKGMLHKDRHGRYRAESAAQQMEIDILVGDTNESQRKAPNYDIMRSIQVADSDPDQERRLRLANVVALTEGKDKEGAPIEIETITREVTFTTVLTIDRYLQSRQTDLGWQDEQIQLIERLPRVVNFWTQNRLGQEASRTRKGVWRSTFDQIAGHYVNDQLAENEFIMQLGWGGGWDSKTLGTHLTDDTHVFYDLVKTYERHMDRNRSFKRGDRYPKSRRVVIRNNRPAYTLGWIKVRMDKLT